MAPTIFSDPQNLTRGINANGSWKLRKTELMTMRNSAYSSPAMIVTSSDGKMAHVRVRNARRTGFILISRKPSMTN